MRPASQVGSEARGCGFAVSDFVRRSLLKSGTRTRASTSCSPSSVRLGARRGRDEARASSNRMGPVVITVCSCSRAGASAIWSMSWPAAHRRVPRREALGSGRGAEDLLAGYRRVDRPSRGARCQREPGAHGPAERRAAPHGRRRQSTPCPRQRTLWTRGTSSDGDDSVVAHASGGVPSSWTSVTGILRAVGFSGADGALLSAASHPAARSAMARRDGNASTRPSTYRASPRRRGSLSELLSS